MCGIVGALAFDASSRRITLELISRMRDSIAHRGPDGADAWVADDRRIGLGFRRLAVIDLSCEAMQPMANEDGSVRIVFNGEIYNHAEIRRELQALGNHHWRTDHSDTEVIVHGFEEWGIECIKRLRGMFAIAIWDARNEELWLVRDRIGVKPLYYSVHHGRVVFGSEIKALLVDDEQPREVDEEAFFHYLTFLTTPAPQTLFAGISKVAPGTWLQISADGTIRGHSYWDVWDHVTPVSGLSDDQIAEHVLEELRTSVRLRKLSDIPVGVFLSGGLDSSTNAALFAEQESAAVHTFSIGYDRDYRSYKNELEHARAIAELLRTDHHEQRLNEQDLLDFLPRMIWLQDEPIADPVCVPLYFVSKLARDHGVAVCQVGEGADELFCGYPRWKQLLALQRWDSLGVPRPVKRVAAGLARTSGLGATRAYEALRRGAAGIPIFWAGAEAFTDLQKKRQILSPRLRRDFADLTSWDVIAPIRRRFEMNAWDQSPLHWFTYADLSLRIPELLLMRVDKMSMGVGLEARVPFLDHRFVEYALSIPASTKTRTGSLKYILKKAVRDLLPAEVINRKKQGFGVPVDDWVYSGLGDRARSELAAFCSETDLLDRDGVMKLIDERRGKDVWRVLNFALWWREYIR